MPVAGGGTMLLTVAGPYSGRLAPFALAWCEEPRGTAGLDLGDAVRALGLVTALAVAVILAFPA